MTTKKQPTRARTWSVTQSADKMDRDQLLDALDAYNYAGQLEIGKGGYHHFQVMVQSHNQIRFDALKKKLPNAHIEPLKGSTQQLYDYVTKHDTAVAGSQFSKGELTLSNKGALKRDFEDFRDEIKAGASLSSLIVSDALRMPEINALREYEAALRAETNRYRIRDVEVFYLYGESGTGKTRGILESYDPKDVYRVSDYRNPFDDYNGEDVLILDEFYDSLPFPLLLNVLDRYPLRMPARYTDKWAGYSIVWIISNRRLPNQYLEKQAEDMTEYLPFLRRINHAYEQTRDSFECRDAYLDHYFAPELRA